MHSTVPMSMSRPESPELAKRPILNGTFGAHRLRRPTHKTLIDVGQAYSLFWKLFAEDATTVQTHDKSTLYILSDFLVITSNRSNGLRGSVSGIHYLIVYLAYFTFIPPFIPSYLYYTVYNTRLLASVPSW
jgi:hypothetical protein